MFDLDSLTPEFEELKDELVQRLQDNVGLDAETAERVADEVAALARERGPELGRSLLGSTGLGFLFGL